MSVRKWATAFVTFSVAFFAALLGGGTAVASPLLDDWAYAPGHAAEYRMGESLGGNIVSPPVCKPVPEDSEYAVKREEFLYETGVIKDGRQESIKANVLTPENPDGTLVYVAPPTDSNSSHDKPSEAMERGEIDGTKEALLKKGKTVITADIYGTDGTQYAGVLNGRRANSAIQAYKNLYGQPLRIGAYGFSGGGIDVLRMLADPAAPNIDVAVPDSGPGDLVAFPAFPKAQNGLALSAMLGLLGSLPPEDREVLDPHIHESVRLAAKLYNGFTATVPVPKLAVGILTVGGALFPVTVKTLLKDGAMDDPEVQRVLAKVSPSVGPGAKQIVFRGNSTDYFVPMKTHVYPWADQYRAQGSNVTVITNHDQPLPGHATMTSELLVSLLDGNIPSGDVDTYSEVTLQGKLTSVVIGTALDGIAVWGEVLNRELPPILNRADELVVDADQFLDQLTPPTPLPVPPVIPAVPAPSVVIPPVVPLVPVTPPQAAEQVVRALPSEVQEPVKTVLQSPEAQRVLEHPAVKQLTKDPLVQGALSLLPTA